MNSTSLNDWRSPLRSERFEMSAISQVFIQRNTPTDSTIHAPLSVGKEGVTEQLENIAKSLKTDGRKLVIKGDIVINSRSDRRGASGLSSRTGSVSLIYIVLEPRLNRIDPGFAHHLIRSEAFQEEFYRFGTGIVADLWSTRYERMAQIRIPHPPLETQQRIADYLDRETAEIDAAVADLDKYVELLEKRKWQQLNEIIESSPHSKVRLSVAAKMKTGTTPSPVIENEDGVPWLKPDGLAMHSTGQRIDFEMLGESLLSPAGTTYVCGIGTVGKVGYSEESSTTNQQITALTPVLNVIPKLFYFSVLTLTDRLRGTAPGSTLPILNNTRLGTYSVRIPDLDVQRTVLAEIESLFYEIDALIAESTKLRDLLLKRRSVLITEVVTGRKQV